MARQPDNLPLILIGGALGLLWLAQRPKAAIPLPSPLTRPPGTPRTGPTAQVSGTSEYTKWVQMTLNQVAGVRLTVDGIYGPLTKAAVARFQAMWGITADGIVGPETDYYLKSALGLPGYIEQPYGGSEVPLLPEPGQVWY